MVSEYVSYSPTISGPTQRSIGRKTGGRGTVREKLAVSRKDRKSGESQVHHPEATARSAEQVNRGAKLTRAAPLPAEDLRRLPFTVPTYHLVLERIDYTGPIGARQRDRMDLAVRDRLGSGLVDASERPDFFVAASSAGDRCSEEQDERKDSWNHGFDEDSTMRRRLPDQSYPPPWLTGEPNSQDFVYRVAATPLAIPVYQVLTRKATQQVRHPPSNYNSSALRIQDFQDSVV